MIGEFLIQFGDKPPRSYLFTQVLNQLQQAIQDLAKKEAKAQSMQPWLHSKGCFFFPRQATHSVYGVLGIGHWELYRQDHQQNWSNYPKNAVGYGFQK